MRGFYCRWSPLASGNEVARFPRATFHLFRARRLQRSSFLRPAPLDRGAERRSCDTTGPREKIPGPQEWRGGGEIAPKVSLRATGARKIARRGLHARLFCVGPSWAARQIVSRPRRHTAGCRRGGHPLWLHSQNGRRHLTCYPEIVCAAASSVGRDADRASGKKTGKPAPRICASVAFRRPAPPTPSRAAKQIGATVHNLESSRHTPCAVRSSRWQTPCAVRSSRRLTRRTAHGVCLLL